MELYLYLSYLFFYFFLVSVVFFSVAQDHNFLLLCLPNAWPSICCSVPFFFLVFSSAISYLLLCSLVNSHMLMIIGFVLWSKFILSASIIILPSRSKYRFVHERILVLQHSSAWENIFLHCIQVVLVVISQENIFMRMLCWLASCFFGFSCEILQY